MQDLLLKGNWNSSMDMNMGFISYLDLIPKIVLQYVCIGSNFNYDNYIVIDGYMSIRCGLY